MANDRIENPKTDSLDELAQSSQPGLAAELLDFLKYNKKWWLLPILLVLGVFGVLLAMASTAAAPFIYTLF
ncbi:hypothetical protein SAMN05444166_3686 [Singulisphaera sp. GP187]|uniref:DUF5989 family protein n=1 Tax=Singulisphaera sp. GP187 TaxID=1882752 RepID=UPI00092808F3|nr:DUF5989 family protein [Singulisphaera sp. GP187]SIO31071.1 hypothetical protein SAMN05444166_3686 [Singulisphaera sp. GP187]